MLNLNIVSKIVYTITFLTLFVEFFFPNFDHYFKRSEITFFYSIIFLTILVLEFYKRYGFSLHSFRILYFAFFAVAFFIKIIMEINWFPLNISLVIFTIITAATEIRFKMKKRY
jgi:hypothetical protein